MGLRWFRSAEREREREMCPSDFEGLAYRHLVLCCEKCFSSLRRGGNVVVMLAGCVWESRSSLRPQMPRPLRQDGRSRVL